MATDAFRDLCSKNAEVSTGGKDARAGACVRIWCTVCKARWRPLTCKERLAQAVRYTANCVFLGAVLGGGGVCDAAAFLHHLAGARSAFSESPPCSRRAMCRVEDESNFLRKSVCNYSTVFSRQLRRPRWPQYDAILFSSLFNTCTEFNWRIEKFDCCAHLSIKVLYGRVILLHEVAGHELDSERRLADAPRPKHHHLELLHRDEAPGLELSNHLLHLVTAITNQPSRFR